MADHGITSPLLSHPPSDHSHLILTIQDDTDTDSHHNGTHTHQSTSAHCHHSRNPFTFLRSDGFTVPVSTTVDPFQNHTLEITGVYEWLKIKICLLVALALLVLFGGVVGDWVFGDEIGSSGVEG
ncbi:hypothetical protein TB2_018706 [Malus domestica]